MIINTSVFIFVLILIFYIGIEIAIAYDLEPNRIELLKKLSLNIENLAIQIYNFIKPFIQLVYIDYIGMAT